MMVIRPVTENDFDAIMNLANRSGVGMTTLPKDEKVIESHIVRSVKSISSAIKKPKNEYYFFVLEDQKKGQIAGCCAIKAAAGNNYPLYSYKVGTVTRVSYELNIRKNHSLLYLVNDLQGKTEICTLFLLPEYREGGNGVLLSRSRFLFMGQFRQRFTDMVFAEMRGISDEQGNSPFWDSLGRHFFDMDFARADFLTAVTNKQFIADLMPREPIYTSLLSKEAQASIGKPHHSTIPAMKILEKQGFAYNEYVDIFDAGPTIVALFDHIKTISNARPYTVKLIDEVKSLHPVLIANSRLDFRAKLGHVVLHDDQTVTINSQCATGLQVSPDDNVYISPL